MTATLPFPSQRQSFSDDELLEINNELETAPASTIIRWAVDNFSPHLCLTASMNDAVLIDLAVKVDPAVEVVFIDTGYHFPETLDTVETVRRRYGLNMKIMSVPDNVGELWKTDPDNCCSALKVQQLERALAGKAAWMSGIRRAEADTRSQAHIVGRDLRGLVKVNPIANWSDVDVESYIQANDVPVNPLLHQGYGSIGCMPCTEPIADGEDARAGRWRGSSKTECGLHLS